MSVASQFPLVSVIIPCYDAEKYLSECIESVLEQSYENYEIIVVNDGSTDKTSKIIKSYGSKVKDLSGNTNYGASVARNKGTELADGEFIQYLDADDLLLPDSLEIKVGDIADGNYDIAYADWQELIEDEEGVFHKGAVKTKSIEDVNEDPSIALFTTFWAPPAAYLFKSSIVKLIGGFKHELTFGEDARFVFDAAEKGAKFKKVNKIGAYYRILKNGNLSKSNPKTFLNDIYKNTLDVESLWSGCGQLSQDQINALTSNYDYTARNLFESDYELFKDNLNSLYNIQPGFRFTWPKVAGSLARLVGYKNASYIMKSLFPLNKS